jgi:hypothetical protein
VARTTPFHPGRRRRSRSQGAFAEPWRTRRLCRALLGLVAVKAFACGSVIALLLAALVSSGIGGAATPTRIVAHVTPFAADGTLRGGLRVAVRGTGTCEAGSDALSSAVYRCFSSHRVLDPCWRDHRRSKPVVVVCLLMPWAKSVVELTLNANPGPTTGTSATRGEPWGIELTTGQRCIALQGAHDTVNHQGGGVPIDYSCGGTLVLLRGVDRSSSMWTIRAARTRSSQPDVIVGSRTIKVAWFGGNSPRS